MSGYTFHLIPHTHWDREWYLPHSILLPRLVSALDDLIVRLSSHPDSTFLLDGQTVLLEDYLRIRPDLRATVVELVRAGRLQVGPWYILADELIPAGESLIRNLLAGQADAARLGGRTDVLYSPDAFGHPAVLPQLAGEFGIRFGVVWRGVGGEAGQEHDFYRWRGPDGCEVLLYHLPPDGYEVGVGLVADAERLPRAWAGVRSSLVERAATRHVAIFVGADHHAAHPAVVSLRELLSQLEPSSTFRISRLHDFFLAAAVDTAAVTLLTGELRWSYGYTWTLQGVHGTRAPLKRRHALAELSLARLADPLAALALVLAGSDRRALLDRAWRLLLQSEFHDSLAGCTSDAVARRVEIRLEDAENLASEVARGSLDELIGNDSDRVRADPEIGESQLVLWNPVPRPRSGVVVADLSWFRRDVLVGPPGDRVPKVGLAARPFHLVTATGAVPVQLMGRRTGQERLDAPHHYPDQDEVEWTRVAFRASELGGLGVACLRVGQGTRPVDGDAELHGRTLGNQLIEVRIGRTGTIELTDRRTRQRYNNLLAFESGSDVGDTYTYAAPARERTWRSGTPVSIRPLAAGPLVAAMELQGSLAAGDSPRGSGPGRVTFRMIVSLHAASPAVRCSLTIDNRALNHRLRLRLPTGLAGGSAVAGGQLGEVVRDRTSSPPREYRRERPVSTAPAHRYVAHAAKNRGLALLAPGFFEYELDPKGDLLVTVLRAVGQLSRADLSTRPGHAGWPIATPGAQCLGSDRLQFAIAPLTGAQLESGTLLPEQWEDLFLPIRPVWLRQAPPLALRPFEVRLEGEGLVFSTVKSAERGDAMVLRCYNATSRSTAGAWHLSASVRMAQRARADEQTLHEIRLDDGGRIIPFHAAAHEIVTIVVTLASSG